MVSVTVVLVVVSTELTEVGTRGTHGFFLHGGGHGGEHPHDAMTGVGHGGAHGGGHGDGDGPTVHETEPEDVDGKHATCDSRKMSNSRDD